MGTAQVSVRVNLLKNSIPDQLLDLRLGRVGTSRGNGLCAASVTPLLETIFASMEEISKVKVVKASEVMLLDLKSKLQSAPTELIEEDFL